MTALFITSFGLGLSFVPMTLTAVHNVAEDRAGVASALVNMAQQIGAALGLAIFTTVSLSAADARLPDAGKVLRDGLMTNDAGVVATATEALTYGYTTAFLVGAGMLLAAAVIVIVAVHTRRTQGAAVTGAIA
jgi:hypothetical protein